MKYRRKAAFTSITDHDDGDIDNVTSYCPKCAKYNIQQLLGERVYPYLGESDPIPSDHDLWLQCHRCGLIIPKIHAERQTAIKPFIDPPKNILDSGKVTVIPFNTRSKQKTDIMNKIIRDRPGSNDDGDRDPIVKKDKDIQAMLAKGKQLTGYSSSTSTT